MCHVRGIAFFDRISDTCSSVKCQELSLLEFRTLGLLPKLPHQFTMLTSRPTSFRVLMGEPYQQPVRTRTDPLPEYELHSTRDLAAYKL